MTSGIHHVTAVSGRIDRTLKFYGGMLGLRLVKRTVNYDDPETYHLYFGDQIGRPGTILAFFPWRWGPGTRRGGTGGGHRVPDSRVVAELPWGSTATQAPRSCWLG